MTKEHTQISDGPNTADRLAAELSFNRERKDHEPVTDSSLTYGDLRLLAKQCALISDAARAVEEYSCRTAVPHIATEMSGLAQRLREAAMPDPTPSVIEGEPVACDCGYCIDGLQADGETPCPSTASSSAALIAERDELRRDLANECDRRDDIIACEVHLRKFAEAENAALKAALEKAYETCAQIAEGYERAAFPGMEGVVSVTKKDIAHRIRKARALLNPKEGNNSK